MFRGVAKREFSSRVYSILIFWCARRWHAARNPCAGVGLWVGMVGHRWGRRLEGFDTLCKGGALGRTLEQWNPYDSVIGRLPVLGSLLGREPVSGRLPVLGLLPVLGRLPVLGLEPVLERLPDGFFHG